MRYLNLKDWLLGFVAGVLLMVAVDVLAEPVEVRWQNPTQNVDGSAIPSGELERFDLYARMNSADEFTLVSSVAYTNGAVTTATFDLECGEIELAAKVANVDGEVSAFSNQVVQTVDCPPNVRIPLPPILLVSQVTVGWMFPAQDFGGTISDRAIFQDPIFQAQEGRFEVVFTSNSANSGAIFSRDRGGQEEGGHLGMTINASGQIEVRHQSANPGYALTNEETNNYVRGGQVVAGREHRVVYSFGDAGAILSFDGQVVDSSPSWQIGIDENNLPMAIGVSQGSVGPDNPENYTNPFLGNIAVTFYTNQ